MSQLDDDFDDFLLDEYVEDLTLTDTGDSLAEAVSADMDFYGDASEFPEGF